MLGQDVATAAEAAGHEPVALARGELDISDAGAVAAAVAEMAPEVVVNCAAWTNVDSAEFGYEDALAVNGAGAGHVAAAAQRRRGMDDPRLHRLRVRRRQARAVPGVRPGRAALGLRALQAGGRARGGGQRPRAPHDRALVVAVRTGGRCFPRPSSRSPASATG